MGSAVQMKGKLDEVLKEIQNIQQEIGKVTNQRIGLNSQLTENELVKKELALLSDDSTIYKLVGPVLIKQDLVEANSNVGKRIEYINGELKRIDDQVKGLEGKQVRSLTTDHQYPPSHTLTRDSVCGLPKSPSNRRTRGRLWSSSNRSFKSSCSRGRRCRRKRN
mmetsp:Transcript_11093/g.34021  ORF Transcript_11093/g.34021 Transcript_11093/m.34021 type:complete len:164 (-) Transcript_11093:34-525(-)